MQSVRVVMERKTGKRQPLSVKGAPPLSHQSLRVIFYLVCTCITEIIQVVQCLLDICRLKIDAVMITKNRRADSSVITCNDFIYPIITIINHDFVDPGHLQLIEFPDATRKEAIFIKNEILLKSLLLCKDTDTLIADRQNFRYKIYHLHRFITDYQIPFLFPFLPVVMDCYAPL